MKTRITALDRASGELMASDCAKLDSIVSSFEKGDDGSIVYSKDYVNEMDDAVFKGANEVNWSEDQVKVRLGYGRGMVNGRQTGRIEGTIMGAAGMAIGIGLAAISSVLEKKENREAIKEFTKDKVNGIRNKFKKNKDEVVEVETTDVEEE